MQQQINKNTRTLMIRSFAFKQACYPRSVTPTQENAHAEDRRNPAHRQVHQVWEP